MRRLHTAAQIKIKIQFVVSVYQIWVYQTNCCGFVAIRLLSKLVHRSFSGLTLCTIALLLKQGAEDKFQMKVYIFTCSLLASPLIDWAVTGMDAEVAIVTCSNCKTNLLSWRVNWISLSNVLNGREIPNTVNIGYSDWPPSRGLRSL